MTVIPIMQDYEFIATCPECGAEYWTIISDKAGKMENVTLLAMRCCNEECMYEVRLDTEIEEK